MSKIKVFRFMSNAEFEKYKSGEELYNDTRHKAKTNSVGFCFFNLKDFTPEYAWRFLKGAINPDICVVFEVNGEELKAGYGIYNDPDKTLYELMNFIIKTIKVQEYSTTHYNNQKFRLIRYTKNELNWFKKYNKFEWINK